MATCPRNHKQLKQGVKVVGGGGGGGGEGEMGPGDVQEANKMGHIIYAVDSNMQVGIRVNVRTNNLDRSYYLPILVYLKLKRPSCFLKQKWSKMSRGLGVNLFLWLIPCYKSILLTVS